MDYNFTTWKSAEKYYAQVADEYQSIFDGEILGPFDTENEADKAIEDYIISEQQDEKDDSNCNQGSSKISAKVCRACT